VVSDDLNQEEMNGKNEPMPSEPNALYSLVCSAPAMRLHEANILRFLKEPCSVRLVEVSVFKEFIFDRVGTRRWEPDGDLRTTAKEISKYVADGGSV
jgi:hypothetical protein